MRWGQWSWAMVALVTGSVGCATAREAPPELVEARQAVEALEVPEESLAARDADAARRHLRAAECGLVLDRDTREIEQRARRAQSFAARAEREEERARFGMGAMDASDTAIGGSGQAGSAIGGSGSAVQPDGVTCSCQCAPGQEGIGGSGEPAEDALDAPAPGTVPEPNVPVQPGEEGVGGSGPPDPPTPLENDPYPLDYEEQLHGPPPGIPAQDLPIPPDENGFAPDTGPID
ncbi:MAG TPA: hypothetical protein VK013_01290 [Myxococcaceae bacterium]|nr:hypothetical protein [Myxococcaceae bacterium]